MNTNDLDLVLKLSFDLSKEDLVTYLQVMQDVMEPRRFNEISYAVEEIRGKLEQP